MMRIIRMKKMRKNIKNNMIYNRKKNMKKKIKKSMRMNSMNPRKVNLIMRKRNLTKIFNL